MATPNIYGSTDIYAPVEQAQKFAEQQNALARQKAVRNALGNAIDPRTGRTNWEFAQQIGGADAAPELQAMQQADMMAQADYNKKMADVASSRATASKAASEQEIAEMNEFATYLAPVRDQAGFSAWRNAYVQRYPFLGAMIPEAYTPEVKADILQKTKAKMENLRFGDEGNMQNVGRDPRTGALVSSGVRRTLSPYEQGQLDVSRGNLKVAQDRLALDQSKIGTGTELAPKERQNREAAFPKASAGFKGAINEIDTLRKDLLDLQSHRGLSGITGAIEGRLPSMSAGSTSAQALLNKILARGQFRELQNMRNNSPTGGALGAISDRENASLRAAFGALDQAQSKEDFQKAINDIISQLDFSKGNITQAFEDTYSYRQGAAPAGAPAAPAAAGPRKTKSGVTYTVED